MVTQLHLIKMTVAKGIFTFQGSVDLLLPKIALVRTCVTFLNSGLLSTLLLTCVVVGEIALTHMKNHVNQVSGEREEKCFFPRFQCELFLCQKNWQDRVFFSA